MTQPENQDMSSAETASESYETQPVSTPNDRSETAGSNRAHAAKPAKKSGGMGKWLFTLVFLLALLVAAYFVWQKWFVTGAGATTQTPMADVLQAIEPDSQKAPEPTQTARVNADTSASLAADDATNANHTAATQAAAEHSASWDVVLNGMQNNLKREAERIDSFDRRQKLVGDELVLLRERLGRTEDAVSRLAEQSVQAETALKMDQLEGVLLMGQERYKLFGDRHGAKQALKLADNLLATLEGPRFSSLRQTLAGEQAALEAMPSDPREAMGVTLAEVGAEIDYLPTLKGAEIVLADEEDPKYLQKLASLVTLRRQTDGVSTVTESQKVANMAVIDMALSRAKLALTLSDRGAFASALQDVQKAVKATFSGGDTKTQSVLGKIDTLLNTEMSVQVPALGSTLAELQQVRALNTLSTSPSAASATPSSPIATPPITTEQPIQALPAPVAPESVDATDGDTP